MRKIAIIHAKSDNGSLSRLANAFAVGARSVRGTATLLLAVEPLTDAFWTAIIPMDALVFGSVSTLSGSCNDFEAFAQQSLLQKDAKQWKGKIAGGFASSGTGITEELATLRYLQAFAERHAMNWIAPEDVVPLGLPSEPSVADRLESWRASMTNSRGNGERTKGDLVAAERYGKLMAMAAHADLTAGGSRRASIMPQ